MMPTSKGRTCRHAELLTAGWIIMELAVLGGVLAVP
jgi:hypothetical protein